MPTRSTILSTMALGFGVSLYANGAHAQSAEPAAAPPQVMIVVEQPAPMVVAPPPPAQLQAPRPAREKEEEVWYGYQTLLVDGAALGLMLGGAAMAANANNNDSGAYLLFAGAGAYVLAAPIVHWAHGRIGPGFGSLGLRVGLPLSGLFWGAVIGSMSDNGRGDNVGTGAAVGFLGGMAGAILLDAALLGYEKPSEKEKEAYESAKAKHPITWLPSLSPQKTGATVGVSGLFF